MQQSLWRMPARLLRQEHGDPAFPRLGHRTELAHGPLVDLVRMASTADEGEGMLLSIDCAGSAQRLVWADIRALRREPDFPVDI